MQLLFRRALSDDGLAVCPLELLSTDISNVFAYG